MFSDPILLNMMLPQFFGEYLVLSVFSVVIIEALFLNHLFGLRPYQLKGFKVSLLMNIISTIFGGLITEDVGKTFGVPALLVFYLVGSVVIETIFVVKFFHHNKTWKKIGFNILKSNVTTYVILLSSLLLLYFFD